MERVAMPSNIYFLKKSKNREEMEFHVVFRKGAKR